MRPGRVDPTSCTFCGGTAPTSPLSTGVPEQSRRAPLWTSTYFPERESGDQLMTSIVERATSIEMWRCLWQKKSGVGAPTREERVEGGAPSATHGVAMWSRARGIPFRATRLTLGNRPATVCNQTAAHKLKPTCTSSGGRRQSKEQGNTWAKFATEVMSMQTHAKARQDHQHRQVGTHRNKRQGQHELALALFFVPATR